jgi:hypothetical protein
MNNLKILEAHAKEAREKLHKIEEELRDAQYKIREAKLDPLKELVTEAHSILCPYNHNDGCGWMYEENNWDGWTHQRWLSHYGNLVFDTETGKQGILSIDRLYKILGKIKELKAIDPSALWLVSHRLTP